MTREPIFFSSLGEVRKNGFTDLTIFKPPIPVRVKGKLGEDKNLRFVQVATAIVPTPSPHPVAIVGTKGKQVIVISPCDVISMSK